MDQNKTEVLADIQRQLESLVPELVGHGWGEVTIRVYQDGTGASVDILKTGKRREISLKKRR